MNSKIQILDTTLRDGGLGLEDAWKNDISDNRFSKDDNVNIINHLKNSGIDIIELGSIEISKEDKSGFAVYQNVKGVSEMIPKGRENGQMYVGLFRGPDTPVNDIPKWNPDLVDGLRVIIRYSELQKSLDFCAVLAEKGYKVFVQPMLTMRYTDEELNLIVREANEMKAWAVYLVDSYGYMQIDDIRRIFDIYDNLLDDNIKIGFHAHNNMNLAFSNAMGFIKHSKDRDIIIDSCAIGMGQGAGNLQTELIVPYIMQEYSGKYNYSEILEVCEIVNKYLVDNIWGYSVERLLPALHHTAYKYAIALRKKYGFSFREINEVLTDIPEQLKNRYTIENLNKLLTIKGKN